MAKALAEHQRQLQRLCGTTGESQPDRDHIASGHVVEFSLHLYINHTPLRFNYGTKAHFMWLLDKVLILSHASPRHLQVFSCPTGLVMVLPRDRSEPQFDAFLNTCIDWCRYQILGRLESDDRIVSFVSRHSPGGSCSRC